MISVLKTPEDLLRKQSFVDSLFKDCGVIYLQEFRSLLADFQSKEDGKYCVFIDEKNDLVSAFEKKSESLWQCTISGYPVLCRETTNIKTLESFLDHINNVLNTTTLYFPLVYGNYYLFEKLRKISLNNYWVRLPCPIIKGDVSPSIIWDRILERYGSRANRQRKKFERKLVVKPVYNDIIGQTIQKIELRSWKRKFFQDMLSRGNQFVYYTNIIKSGLANITVAFDQNEPVAYRVDSIVNKTLYVIKWSFDERYKQYSPGFYLLMVDLFEKYKNSKFRYIDLYGSPDMLKDKIETHRLERFDICYSTNSQEVENVKKERVAFDCRLFNNYQNKQSIKKIFNN